jgi:hypothetical protein
MTGRIRKGEGEKKKKENCKGRGERNEVKL